MFFFIPFGTNRPHWRFPYATYGLIFINLLVYFVQRTAHITPGFVPAQPSLWAWSISLFTHGGLLHLLGNMLFLWLFGTLAEDVLGIRLFLACYFGGAAAATGLDWLISSRFSPGDLGLPRLGASGAIAGIMGLSAVCFLRTKVKIGDVVWLVTLRVGTAELGAPLFLGLWVGWEVLQGAFWTYAASHMRLVGGVAHWAHVGGFLFGLVGALVLGLHKKVPRQDLIAGRRHVTDTFEAHSQVGELEKLVKQSPQDAAAWKALGRALEVGGRQGRAGQAYEQAMKLYLEQRNGLEAAKAYRAASACLLIPDVPEGQQFELASGLERLGYHREAYALFRELQVHHPGEAEAETALMRAGEIAKTHLGQDELARDCYQLLLQNYPCSAWAGLAQEKLRRLGDK
jgi:membrane associated rhomboid family serine protease